MDTQFQACQPSTSKVSFASEEEVFVVSGAESRPEPFGDACDDCVDSSSSCAASEDEDDAEVLEHVLDSVYSGYYFRRGRVDPVELESALIYDKDLEDEEEELESGRSLSPPFLSPFLPTSLSPPFLSLPPSPPPPPPPPPLPPIPLPPSSPLPSLPLLPSPPSLFSPPLPPFQLFLVST